ncbi:MAG: membrane integrity-associated transporter subunit PqiC [Burkholderiales bacterium]|nr:membrane integrity-associated transporter subunit PqiC [Burkholderiales bacterium]
MMATRRDWMRRTLAAMAMGALVALGGCSLTRPAPVKETFVLEPPLPAATARSQKGVLRVGTVTVGAPFRGRSFVFRETDLRYETDYYHEFLVAPAANIADATVRALAAAKVFASVVPASVIAEPDWVLEGFVDALYGDARDAGKPAAVLSITWYLRRGDNDAGVPVWSKKYERRVPFAAGSTNAYATALNDALGDILAELARDLEGLKLP